MNDNLLTIFIVLTVFLFFTLLFLWRTYNEMVRKRNQVRTDFSDIDVQLKRRASLIENLANMVKAYAKHEEDTFENVAKARAALDTSKSVTDAARAENMFSQTLRSLFSVVENYPKLQANQNYLALRDDLKETENNIAKYREQYNLSVQSFNNYIQTFPNLLSAAIFHFEEAELFQTSAADESDVTVQ